MVRFKVEIKVVVNDKSYMTKKNEYVEKFQDSVSEYLGDMRKNNYNVKEIELNLEEWYEIENVLPSKYGEDDSIFIKDDILYMENSAFIDGIRSLLPETGGAKIIKIENIIYIRPIGIDDNIYIRPIGIDDNIYIDEYIVKMIKDIICKGSINDKMFEFIEPILKLSKIGQRYITVEKWR